MALSIAEGTRAEVAEAGHTVVDPRARGQRLVVRLSAALLEACRNGGFSAFVHYPTTAHTIMQKLAVAGGGIETGILHGTIPEETRYEGVEGDGGGSRRAVVVAYQPVAEPKERRVHLPERYADRLRGLYAATRLPRHFEASTTPGPEPSRIELAHHDARRLRRLRVPRVGPDLVEAIEGSLRADEEWLVHLDLPLESPWPADATRALARRGFFFAALLPGFPDGDTLRLQRLPHGERALAEPELASDEARALFRFQCEDLRP